MRCVVDNCSYEPESIEDLNAHSRACHLQPNPYPNGTSHRYPGADRAGDFAWWAYDEGRT